MEYVSGHRFTSSVQGLTTFYQTNFGTNFNINVTPFAVDSCFHSKLMSNSRPSNGVISMLDSKVWLELPITKTRLFEYIENFTTKKKTESFQIKIDIFPIFAQNIDCGYSITKTYLYNFDPLKPHLYIVKLGFTGV